MFQGKQQQQQQPMRRTCYSQKFAEHGSAITKGYYDPFLITVILLHDGKPQTWCHRRTTDRIMQTSNLIYSHLNTQSD